MPLLGLFNNLNIEFNKNETKNSQSDVTLRKNYFDKIPNEIVSIIFEKLETEDQKKLTTVCQRFKNLLFASKSFTQSLTIIINAENLPKNIHDFPYTEIHALYDANFHRIRKKIFKIAQTHQKSIQKLQLGNCSEIFLTNILSFLKDNLTVLFIDSIERKCAAPYDKIKIDFPNLKVLSFQSSAIFLKHIGHHKIEEMTIDDQKTAEVSKFLQSCDKLKKLTLGEFLPPYDPKVHNFKLFQLELYFEEEPNEEVIKNFLQPHKESLRKLKVIGYQFTVVKYAIREMKVEELDYKITDSQIINEENFNANNFIKKLKINIKFYEDGVIKGIMSIIKACRNVEDLKLICGSLFVISKEILKNFSLNLKNLKHLTLPRMTSIIESLHFDRLETLRIHKVYSKDEHKSWISLATCCPNLKKVFITQGKNCLYHSNNCFSIVSSDLKNLLNSCKNLQELHIGPYFDITDEFIETILNSESKSFWYLKIESEDFEEDGERAKKFEGTKIRCDIVRSYCNDDDEGEVYPLFPF